MNTADREILGIRAWVGAALLGIVATEPAMAQQQTPGVATSAAPSAPAAATVPAPVQAAAGTPASAGAPAPPPTSAPAGPPAPAGTAGAGRAGSGNGRKSASSVPRDAQDEAGEPRASAAGGTATTDRVRLDATTVTGNQELPKVMYVVPWKKSDVGDLSGRPQNSLLDEILQPVDRDVFRREVTYYQAVKADSPNNNAAPPK
jgi:hypothetical protein